MRRVATTDGKDKVMTETMIQRHKCKCSDCGHSHWVERVVEMETLPVGVEISIVPDSESERWELTIVNNIQGTTAMIECDTMKQCLIIIEHSRKMLMKDGYRFIVVSPRSRFETHSRVNRLEYNQFVDDTFKTKKKKDDWYSDLIQKMGRGSVRSSNKVNRLGYNK
jgi:hypothetical protein